MNISIEKLLYSKEHEWLAFDGEVVTIGITDFAATQLGDIVYLELPEVGTKLTCGDSFGVVESIKSVSDLYTPVSGEVILSNQDLSENPALINDNAFDNWLIKIKFSNSNERSTLLSKSAYDAICG